MSNATNSAGAATADDLLAAESNLGQALAVIHRLLPRLEESSGTNDVQGAFRRAVACLEAAREAHLRFAQSHATRGIAGETVAAISAAIAVVLGQPFRLVSVQKVPAPVPHLNVWALEGRTQIFQSHKVR